MLFNSFEFMLFLPIVFILYWFVIHSRQWQNMLIVVASYVFYGWWNTHFLILIALTSLCSYATGRLIEHYNGRNKIQQFFNVTNITLNLAILGIFKYYNFFIENFDALLRTIGWHADWVTLNVVLPVGISFYTFQALSYTIDVYRGKIRATHDIVEFFAYICFFPQLVAGPIERATNLLPQFQNIRYFDYTKSVDGCRQMLWGFFKKMIIADNCALAVNSIWAGYNEETGFVLLVGAVLFTFQIYCDFSGYSDIAIGCARLFGINLMRNFNFPYFSKSVPDFWRRWHISLTTWFRDYIYFPLGGSRCNKWKAIRNVYIVWSISGLWHGANWTFVCWGLYHATLLAIYNILNINTKDKHAATIRRYVPNIKEFCQIIITFTLTTIGWIIFRAETLSDATKYIMAICNRSLLDIPNSLEQLKGHHLTIIIPAVILMVLFEWIQRDKQHALQFTEKNILFRHTTIRYAFYIALATITLGLAGSQSDFIYFQF